MACGRQSSSSGEHLVNRAVVDARGGLLAVTLGNVPDQGDFNVELLGLRVIDHMDGLVPSGSFEVEAETEDTIFWLLCYVLRLDFIVNLEVHGQLINSNDMLSGIVLKGSGEEGLGEEESGEPVSGRHRLVNPLRDEGNPFVQVSDPRREWLEREEADVREGVGHLVVEQRVGQLVKVLTHDDLSTEGLLHVLQHLGHDHQKPVVTDDLLGEHGVHGLVVLCGILLDHLIVVEGGRSLGFKAA
mmetsp:Transcript_11712/g.17854  ORF Transcript_11712/g.17854 Transcript_11712/m.17854 type:complete len:243 (+) Transcript_11712:142-870(+)